jgi:hypothetical protein
MIILFSSCRNSNQQGVIGLGEAIAYFTKKHCTVSLPLVDSQDYDIVVDDSACLKKIQVKTTATKKGKWYVVRLVNGSTYDRKVRLNTDKIYDFLFVVTDGHEMYLIPKTDIDQRHSLTLGSKYSKYKVLS